jgi:hypothetical protein
MKQPFEVHDEPGGFNHFDPEPCVRCKYLTRYWLTPHIPMCQFCADILNKKVSLLKEELNETYT